MDFSEFEVTDLTGIERFTNLEYLKLTGQSGLHSLDVSKNTNLTKLYCDGTSLSSLDISKNKRLTDLDCSNTNLRILDLTTNTELIDLDCFNTNLSSLDLWNMPSITGLFYDMTNCLDGDTLDFKSIEGLDADKVSAVEKNGVAITLPEDKKVTGLSYGDKITYAYDDFHIPFSYVVEPTLGSASTPIMNIYGEKEAQVKVVAAGLEAGKSYTVQGAWIDSVEENETATASDFSIELDKNGDTYASVGNAYTAIGKLKCEKVLPVGDYTINVRIKYKDTLGYSFSKVVPVSITVQKATPHIQTLPTASVSYGKKLKDATLSGGEVVASESDDTSVPGTFAFTSGDTKPDLDDSDRTTYEVTFTPDDNDNYTNATGNVTITVKGTRINATNFPDEAFRNMLKENYPAQTSDGVFIPEEIQGITDMEFSRFEVTDLTGIEWFTNLQKLNVSGQSGLTSLDVSKNKRLTNLDCSNTSLINLDVSQNTSLTDLKCSYTNLSSLDVSKNTSLTYIECEGISNVLDGDTLDFNQIAGLNVDKITTVEKNGVAITLPEDKKVADLSYGDKITYGYDGGYRSAIPFTYVVEPTPGSASAPSVTDYRMKEADVKVAVPDLEAGKAYTIQGAWIDSVEENGTVTASDFSVVLDKVGNAYASVSSTDTVIGKLKYDKVLPLGNYSINLRIKYKDALNNSFSKVVPVTLTVQKATPQIKTLPTVTAVTYGKTLQSAKISGGNMVASDGTSVPGTFSFTKGSVNPNFTDSNKTLYDVTFTPNDTGNYTSTTCKVKVKVNPILSKLTYVLNKGTNNKANPTSYGNDRSVTFKNPSRKGYSFGGWYTDSKCKKRIKSISKGTVKNYTLYAKWTKISVKKAGTPKLSNAKTKKLIVKYKKVSGVKGYEITYATNSKFKKGKKVTSTSKTSVTFKKMKKTTYYVRVRAYKLDSAGKKVYGKYSSVKKIKIKK